MKKFLYVSRNVYFLLALPLLFLASCEKQEKDPVPTGLTTAYPLASVSDPAISGTATIIENDNQSVTIELKLNGTRAGGSHPAHIHANTAAEGGNIVVSLSPVNGSTGISRTTVSKFDDGKLLSYQDLLAYDGYVNVHASTADLKTLVAQGDIGQNILTTESKVYQLGSVANPAIKGTATFTKRQNGEALAVIKLDNTVAGGSHPGHIHVNTAAEGGAIALSFAPVDGATGISKTNLSKKDDGTAFKYDDIANFNGYINIHQSATDLATLIAQGDIGQNELTGKTKTYTLGAVDFTGVTGTATFAERKNGTALATVNLVNSPAGGTHPGHIHANTAAQGGNIIFTFKPAVNGVSKTQVAKLENGTAFTYANVLAVNGYINFHESATSLARLVAQGDIGVNELTGKTKSYTLASKDVVGINGTALFSERANGTTLVTLTLRGTPAGGSHPAHIHMNNAAAGGPIVVSLANVNGNTGISKTQVAAFVDNTAVTYAGLLAYNGYINVHASAAALQTLVAQGNIGSNAP